MEKINARLSDAGLTRLWDDPPERPMTLGGDESILKLSREMVEKLELEQNVNVHV